MGSYTQNVKHIIFDNITMNGTASGVRLKTGINSDGTLRGGGEEDFVFSNITMTNVKNPFSIDCYYDKKYTTPEQDKANARPLDSTTPTYNGILLKRTSRRRMYVRTTPSSSTDVPRAISKISRSTMSRLLRRRVSVCSLSITCDSSTAVRSRSPKVIYGYPSMMQLSVMNVGQPYRKGTPCGRPNSWMAKYIS